MQDAGRCPGPPRARTRLEIADVFRAHGETFRERHRLTSEQRAAMRAIEACRTAVLGGHLEVCPACGHERPAYNSCRNRHCPKCQALTQVEWIEKHRARILPIPYFHVVFTLPAQLRPLARLNRARVFHMLFATAAATLQELARDPKRLGARLGFTAVLHTWTRDLSFHPHVHCVVTAGGLAFTNDRWVHGSSRFLFPVRVLSRLFRGKLLAALRRAHHREPFVLPTDELDAFAQLLDRIARIDWVVYAKAPFHGAGHVYEYLGRYTHRVAISNARLIAITDDAVTIRTKGDGQAVLGPVEFIRRFLLHVLPVGFVKIRHYGLMASRHQAELGAARRMLEPHSPPPEPDQGPPRSWQDRLLALTQRDPRVCPHCGATLRQQWLAPHRHAHRSRAPPGEESAP